MPGRHYTNANGYRYGFNGKENDNEVVGTGSGTQDYGMRIYNPALGKFLSVDPLTKSYPMLTPYQFASNRPIDGIDQDGLEWKSIKGGYMWDPDNAYSDRNRTQLKPGYYKQAIHFTDDGTFTETTEFNMGTSKATVYKADGTIKEFDACIYPARADEYATTPEGEYEATVGLHQGKYTALHVHDKGNIGSESINLGAPNPSNPKVNTATGIHIHKAGLNNKTGLTRDGKPISAGCLLIDVNKWLKFIGLFNTTTQRNNTIGVQVSRSLDPAKVEYCGTNPAMTPTSKVDVNIEPEVKVNQNKTDFKW